MKYRLARREVSFVTYTSVTFRERAHNYVTKFITVTILNDNIQLANNALIFHLNYQDILAAVAVAVVAVELVVIGSSNSSSSSSSSSSRRSSSSNNNNIRSPAHPTI